MASTYITDYLERGLAAARPATPPVGTALALYEATDTGALSMWDGSQWLNVVVSITAGTGLSGGTINSEGTIALAAIASHDVLANTTSGSAAPTATTVTALLDAALGSTQGDVLYRSASAWTVLAPGTSGQVLQSGGAAANPSWHTPATGSVTEVDTGTGLSGGPITSSGTINADWDGGVVTALGSGLSLSGGTLDIEASEKIRTIPFPIIGVPSDAQQMNVTLTQGGTLLANGGTAQAYVPTNPTATETLEINTVHNGTITTQGTISINTSGVVTFPTFTAVTMAAGDTIQLLNQATADATFANACISLQYQVT
jgi:hypothetical protein